MDMQRCLGKIFLKLQQYRHGLSAEVVAALLKAGADIGLVGKSVKDCCQDWYAKAATGQLILTPIDIITDYTKLLHFFFVCVCARVWAFFLHFGVEDQKVTAVEYAKGWQDPEIALISHNKAEVGQMAYDGLDRATFYCCIAGSRTMPHRLAWKIDHQPWRNPQTFTGQKMSNMWTVRHRPQQI